MDYFINSIGHNSSYDKPKGSQLPAKTDQHKLYFHKLETSQKDDQVIFGADQKRRYVVGSVTKDNHYLIISASTSIYGNELYIKDLTKPNSPIITIVGDFNSDNRIINNEFRGGSNGGLLVGAFMTLRPHLMKVALPAVGILDMLLNHTFTSGAR